jgi:uncharacterized protein YhfF
MDYLTRKYVIFDVTELDKVDFNHVLETSAETVRKSADGTQTFVKWDGDTPSFMEDIESKSKEYTHDEILEILAGEDWTPPMSIDSSEA